MNMGRCWVWVSVLLLLMEVPAAAGGHPQKVGGEKKPPPERAAPVQTKDGTTDSGGAAYVIGPMDVLEIVVWKEQDFSRSVPVRSDGKISLPLLGDLEAAGFTPMQLAAIITDKLQKFVTQPKVTVILSVMNSQRVYVLGNALKPGPMALLPNMTVLQALATAGGPNQFAKLKEIDVLRNENGKRARYTYDYKKLIRGETADQNMLLRPGDTIVVP